MGHSQTIVSKTDYVMPRRVCQDLFRTSPLTVCEGESWRLQAAAFADFQYVAHRPL